MRSAGILIVSMRGAKSETVAAGAETAFSISRRMWMRPRRACSRALDRSSRVTPVTLMSICSAVMPTPEPATLKSMSPKWSSEPLMSERIAIFLPSWTRPMAMPATGCESGTPATIIARQPPHTLAIEDEPFDSMMSETTRIVYGKRSFGGMTAESARSASMPWPISRRPGPMMRLTSPTE